MHPTLPQRLEKLYGEICGEEEEDNQCRAALQSVSLWAWTPSWTLDNFGAAYLCVWLVLDCCWSVVEYSYQIVGGGELGKLVVSTQCCSTTLPPPGIRILRAVTA